MAFFEDFFTEAVNTDLAAHTPNTGTSWTRLWGTDASTRFFQVENAADQLRCNGNSGDYGFMYTADVTYPSANYEVQATFLTTFSTATPVYLLARVQDQENMYAVRLVLSSGGSNAQLYKKVSGTWSTLGSAVTIADGSVVKLSVNGSAIKVYDDGAEVVSVTDSDISAAGKAGLAHGGGAELVTSTDDTRATNMVDAFSVTDLGAGGTTYNESPSGGLTPSGAPTKQTATAKAGSVTPAGALIRTAAKVLAGATTPTGALSKLTAKIFAGELTPAGALDTIRTYLKSFEGSLTPVGAIIRSTAKSYAGTLTPAAVLNNLVSKFYTGALTPSGATNRSTATAKAGTMSSTGTLARMTGMAFAGSVTPTGTITRAIVKALTGTITATGAISKAITKAFAGAITAAGDLIADFTGDDVVDTSYSRGGLITLGARANYHAKDFTAEAEQRGTHKARGPQ